MFIHIVYTIDSFSLIQHITFPTHYIGHILDLVTPISNILSKPPICLPLITDHNVISLEIDIPSKHTVKTSTVYKDIKSIEFELFSDNIKTNVDNIIPNINSLNTFLKFNIDIFTPTKIHYFKVRNNNYVGLNYANSSTSEAIRSTRKFERIYLKNPSITNYKQLVIARNAYRMKLSLDKRNYYKNNIYGNNSKKLYSITRKILR